MPDFCYNRPMQKYSQTQAQFTQNFLVQKVIGIEYTLNRPKSQPEKCAKIIFFLALYVYFQFRAHNCNTGFTSDIISELKPIFTDIECPKSSKKSKNGQNIVPNCSEIPNPDAFNMMVECGWM